MPTLSKQQASPSRLGEFHPSPSQIRTRTSRFVRLVPLREGCRPPLIIGFVPLPVDPSQWQRPAPFARRALHPLRRYYGAVRPSPAHRYFRPGGWSRLRLFSARLVPGPQPARDIAYRPRQQPELWTELGHVSAVLRAPRPHGRTHRHSHLDLSGRLFRFVAKEEGLRPCFEAIA